MNSIVPIYEGGAGWSDLILEENFKKNQPVPKVQLVGLMAKRSVSNPSFLSLLKAEALDAKNRSEIFFGFIKQSWIPVLAILEHGSEQGRAQLREWIESWTDAERSLFLGYIAKEASFLAWFGKIEQV